MTLKASSGMEWPPLFTSNQLALYATATSVDLVNKQIDQAISVYEFDSFLSANLW